MAVILDEARRGWSHASSENTIQRALLYTNKFNQYVRWRERLPVCVHEGRHAPAYVWRSMDGKTVVHHSLYFEQMMSNFVSGMVHAIRNDMDTARTFFETAVSAGGSIFSTAGEQNTSCLKALIPLVWSLLDARTLTSSVADIAEFENRFELSKRGLSLIPNIPTQFAELHNYSTSMREFFGIHLVHACIARYEAADEFGLAEIAASTLGDETQMTRQYRSLRSTLGGRKVEFDSWLATLYDADTTPLIEPEVIPEEERPVILGFDDLRT